MLARKQRHRTPKDVQPARAFFCAPFLSLHERKEQNPRVARERTIPQSLRDSCLAAARSPLGSDSPKGLSFTTSRPLRYFAQGSLWAHGARKTPRAEKTAAFVPPFLSKSIFAFSPFCTPRYCRNGNTARCRRRRRRQNTTGYCPQSSLRCCPVPPRSKTPDAK